MKLQPFIVKWFEGGTSIGVPSLKLSVASDVPHLGKRARKKLSEIQSLAKENIKKNARITGVWKKVEHDYKWIAKAATDLLFHGVFQFIATKVVLNPAPSKDDTRHCPGTQSTEWKKTCRRSFDFCLILISIEKKLLWICRCQP